MFPCWSLYIGFIYECWYYVEFICLHHILGELRKNYENLEFVVCFVAVNIEEKGLGMKTIGMWFWFCCWVKFWDFWKSIQIKYVAVLGWVQGNTMFPFIQNAGNSKLRITSFGFGRNMNEWKDECLRSSKAELIPILFSATKRDYRVFNRAFFFNFFFF